MRHELSSEAVGEIGGDRLHFACDHNANRLDARFPQRRKRVSPQKTEMRTFDEEAIYQVQAGEEVTCAACGRELDPGEMVTKGLLLVSPHVLVCKFCRPIHTFYVPELPEIQELGQRVVAAHYELTAETHEDGTPHVRLRNRQGGWHQVWVRPEEAEALAAALLEMAAIASTAEVDGPALREVPA